MVRSLKQRNNTLRP